MKTDIVLLSAKQGGGKSTITTLLRERISRSKQSWIAAEVKFADIIYAIHDAAREILRSVDVDVVHEEKDGNLLQLLGTEWGRKTLGEDVWVRAMKGKLDRMKKAYYGVGPARVTFIASDCRFKNEFDAFPEALRIRLIAEESVRRARAEMWRENTTHPSEVDLDEYELAGKFDMTLSTDLESPSDSVDHIMEILERGPLPARSTKV